MNLRCGKWHSFRSKINSTAVEIGFKEAIAQTKEWLAINTEEYARIIDGKEYVERKQLLADFESDMNKLREEQKC